MKLKFSQIVLPIVFAVASVTMVSCFGSKESSSATEEQQTETTVVEGLPQEKIEQAKALLADKIEVVDGKMKINITKAEAEALGVSGEVYDALISQVENANNAISEKLDEAGQAIEGAVEAGKEVVGDAAEAGKELVEGVAEAGKEAVEGAAAKAGEAVEGAADAVKDGGKKLLDKAKSIVK